MRALPAAVLATALLAVAGCGGGDGDGAPKGFTKLGTVSGVPVYVQLTADGFTVNTRVVDDELGCEGSAPLNADGYTELCNTQTPDTYVYAAAFPRANPTPHLCDGRTYRKVKATRLAGKTDWRFDVVAAVGREPTFLTICPEDLLGVTPSATPSGAPSAP